MNKNKKSQRQHYVPQFYLRFFSSDVKHEKIWFYHEKSSYKESDIKRVAQENNFYETENISIEKDLQKIEKEISHHINKFINNKNYDEINNNIEIKNSIYKFIILQFIRNLYFKKLCFETHSKITFEDIQKLLFKSQKNYYTSFNEFYYCSLYYRTKYFDNFVIKTLKKDNFFNEVYYYSLYYKTKYFDNFIIKTLKNDNFFNELHYSLYCRTSYFDDFVIKTSAKDNFFNDEFKNNIDINILNINSRNNSDLTELIFNIGIFFKSNEDIMYTNMFLSEICISLLTKSKDYWIRTLLDLYFKYETHLKFKKMCLIKNTRFNEFITSDNPVVMFDQDYNIQKYGILRSDLVIYLPLSPTIGILLDKLSNDIKKSNFETLNNCHGFLYEDVKIIDFNNFNSIKYIQLFNEFELKNKSKIVMATNKDFLKLTVDKDL